jgi:hypothetical protein
MAERRIPVTWMEFTTAPLPDDRTFPREILARTVERLAASGLRYEGGYKGKGCAAAFGYRTRTDTDVTVVVSFPDVAGTSVVWSAGCWETRAVRRFWHGLLKPLEPQPVSGADAMVALEHVLRGDSRCRQVRWLPEGTERLRPGNS